MSLKPPINPTDTFISWQGLESDLDAIQSRDLDVREFGAVAASDSASVTNSTAITAAIAAANAIGGRVLFDGLYTINSSVLLLSNVTLEGVGDQSGVKVANGRNVQAIANSDTTLGNDNITLRNLYVNANKAGNPSGTSTVIRFLASDANSCDNITVEGCTVDGSMFAGIMLQNCNKFRITGNRVQDTERDGITVWFNSADGVIANNVVSESGDDCIALNSEFTGHTAAKCQRIAITGNTVRQRYDAINFGGGIHALGVEDVTIAGNVIGKSMGPNIFVVNGAVSGASQPSKRVSITGNVCRDCRDASAISIGADTVAATVSSNTCSGYTQQGIQCDAPAVVSGNFLLAGTTTASNGVTVSSTGAGTAITGNRFESCAATGCTITANRCVITGNTFKDCGSLVAGQAYCLISANFNRNTVSGNAFHFLATGSFAVRIASGTGSRNVVTGNVAEGFSAGSSYSDGSTSGTNIIRDNSPSDDPATVASGATLRLDRGSRVYTISGTNNITSITATGREGDVVTLIFTGTAAGTGLTNGSNLKIGANFVYTPDDSITLVCDGTNWYRVAVGAVN